VHGGAGPDSERIRSNQNGYKEGINAALDEGYKILEAGGSAIDAVERAVRTLENNPLFNAGKGSVKNKKGNIEMCAGVMDGEKLTNGAIALLSNVKNPSQVARAVMDKLPDTLLSSDGAIEFARSINAEFAPDNYFEVQHEEHSHGTVGAVACDANGNVAACTSTGGIEEGNPGRIADSAIAGAGVYANNNTCAVSATGEGEGIIKHSLSFHLHALVEFNNMPVNEAAAYLIYQKLKSEEHDLGLIAINKEGTIAMAFNSERMHRGWKTSDNEFGIKIYAD